MKEGARLIIRTISEVAENKVIVKNQKEFMQPGEVLRLAPKLNPEFCIVDWTKDQQTIHNFIRGLAPYPCARSFFRNDTGNVSFKIFESVPEPAEHSYEPGQIISDGKNFLKIACLNGFVGICSLQVEGKKRMGTPEFLRGFRISDFAAII
jgi:methionyl-tRNA formyltransferase